MGWGGFGYDEERPEYRATSLAFLGDDSKPSELVIDLQLGDYFLWVFV